jgi:hypothetical protein
VIASLIIIGMKQTHTVSAKARAFAVKRTGRTWSIVRRDNGAIVEGGFFSRGAADRAYFDRPADERAPAVVRCRFCDHAKDAADDACAYCEVAL